MNARIVTFSVFSLFFIAAYLFVEAVEVNVDCWILISLIVLAIVFAVVPVALVVVDIFRQCKDEALLKSKSKLSAEVEQLKNEKEKLENQKKTLLADIEALKAAKANDMSNHVEALKKKNRQLMEKLDVYDRISARLAHIELLVLRKYEDK